MGQVRAYNAYNSIKSNDSLADSIVSDFDGHYRFQSLIATVKLIMYLVLGHELFLLTSPSTT